MNDKNINDLVIKILNLSKKNKIIMTPIGGMTNSNYLLTIDDVKMVLRLPGVATECFINRGYEKNNSELASLIGINAKTIYFDSATGIKITVYIPDAEVLNPQIVRQQDNIKEISLCFRKLHQSDIKFGNSFNVFSEYEKYKHILDNHYSYLDFFVKKIFFITST
ncbi:choline/ethanolamine kinase family protein [Candidatus Fukatsuia endosymbiont of Tuberolachnus salignus]|uniref:choline/ethanolamine kinase family protein n=1 Tax=Candidatus Fukatsuia endosymbiont of Tuberolachnus salignus TaxID=3077957 RepID=UPI00313AB091